MRTPTCLNSAALLISATVVLVSVMPLAHVASAQVPPPAEDPKDSAGWEPVDALAYVNRGLERYEKRNLDGAIEDFTAAIEIDPKDASTYYNRNLTWGRKRDYDKAIADCNEAIRLAPTNGWYYSSRAGNWLKKGEHIKALSDCNKAVELSPNFAWAYRNRGQTWLAMKEFDLAFKDLTKASQLDPKIPNLARDLQRARQGQEQTQKVSQATSAQSKSTAGGVRQGRSGDTGRLTPQEIDRQIAEYTSYIKADPQGWGFYYDRGVLLMKKKLFEEAIRDFSECLRRQPKWHSAYYNRAWARDEIGQNDLAIADYTKTLQIEPAADAYCERARLWFNKRSYDQALSDLNQSLKLDPNCTLSLVNRGRTWRAKGQNERALADFAEALRIDPRFAPSYAARGDLRLGQKRYDLAMADYTKALELHEDAAAMADYTNSSELRGAAEVYYNRALIHGLNKKWDAAGRDCYKAILAPHDDARERNVVALLTIIFRDSLEISQKEAEAMATLYVQNWKQ